MAKILSIFFLACFATCQETENKRTVTEHQLMNDRGRSLQGLKRLMWLHNAMGGVHTASGRDLSQAHVLLTSKEQDLSDLYDTVEREEMSDMMEPLLLELLGRDTPITKIPKANLLHYLKNGKGHQLLQDLSDLVQMGSQDAKEMLMLRCRFLTPAAVSLSVSIASPELYTVRVRTEVKLYYN